MQSLAVFDRTLRPVGSHAGNYLLHESAASRRCPKNMAPRGRNVNETKNKSFKAKFSADPIHLENSLSHSVRDVKSAAKLIVFLNTRLHLWCWDENPEKIHSLPQRVRQNC
jgi:hypothetical protein